jgi:hypothetical protein
MTSGLLHTVVLERGATGPRPLAEAVRILKTVDDGTAALWCFEILRATFFVSVVQVPRLSWSCQSSLRIRRDFNVYIRSTYFALEIVAL